MKYINPYDIAEIIEFDSLNKENFKKFKKRVLNELELLDDEIEIYNKKFSKNEIYEILEKIDNNRNLLDVYFLLYNEEKTINDFLYGVQNQNIKEVFSDIKFLDETVKIFIEPFITERLSKIYKEAFINKNTDILKIAPPVSQIYLEQVYEPIYKMLKNIQNELLFEKDKNIDLDEVQKIIGDVDFINQLPVYFDKVRNDIALCIRSLSIDVWNKYENADLSIELINLALEFKLNSKNKDMFKNDKNYLLKIKENKKNISILNKIDNILNGYYYFEYKLEKILLILKKIKLNDFLLKEIYVKILIFNKNHSSEILQSFNQLKNLFIFMKHNTNDQEFINILNSNLEEIELLMTKLKRSNDKKQFFIIILLFFFFIFLILFISYMQNGI